MFSRSQSRASITGLAVVAVAGIALGGAATASAQSAPLEDLDRGGVEVELDSFDPTSLAAINAPLPIDSFAPEIAAPEIFIEEAPEQYCPVPGSEFIDSWGFSRSGGRRHKGVDMMAPHGAPVVAPIDGMVRSHNSSLGGLSYYLDGDDGTRLYGAHLQSLTVTGYVEAGTIIGTVGSTGNASAGAPHLHFEIHPGAGAPQNPYFYTAIWCSEDWAGSTPADPQPTPYEPAPTPESFDLYDAVEVIEGSIVHNVPIAPAVVAGAERY